ncbi:Protein of unknown function [Gryllus bimaculatus]|nr:Protein of unknown function [Gryllus bimaculatus]
MQEVQELLTFREVSRKTDFYAFGIISCGGAETGKLLGGFSPFAEYGANYRQAEMEDGTDLWKAGFSS